MNKNYTNLIDSLLDLNVSPVFLSSVTSLAIDEPFEWLLPQKWHIVIIDQWYYA